MYNERNAGRKPKLDDIVIEEIRKRRESGESVYKLAKEYGLSRQALYKRLNDSYKPHETRIDYMVDGLLCTSVFVDRRTQGIRVINYARELSKRAFGYNDAPGMAELVKFLEQQYMLMKGVDGQDCLLVLDGHDGPDVVNELYKGGKDSCRAVIIEEGSSVPKFEFTRKDRLLRRTDTDGFQLKAVSHDRRFFVKSQAVMAGIKLRDWAVEIIASDICKQLSIPCIEQRQCRFVYEGRDFDGVYSPNFELDGYTFVSFEGLLERQGKSSNDDEFIALNAMDKLKWCALRLAEAGSLEFEATFKYMMDMAVLDCLIGNVDRHTRNFGLMYDTDSGSYMIAPLFDNGMGLFENDSYRDEYKTFEEAMNTVYVSPYGEDPFDMIKMLDDEYDLKALYPGIDRIEYPDILSTPFAREYERRMRELWQNTGR